MSGAEEKFSKEFDLMVSFLFGEVDMSREDAVEAVNDLLAAHAAMLAEKILSNTQHIRYGCAMDYAERYAKLITKEGQK